MFGTSQIAGMFSITQINLVKMQDISEMRGSKLMGSSDGYKEGWLYVVWAIQNSFFSNNNDFW